MTEQEIRALVREAIHHRLGERSSSGPVPVRVIQPHASHHRFALPRGTETGGPCLIEPTVPCTHCGYCQSFGH